jgi:hypothetical protein
MKIIDNCSGKLDLSIGSILKVKYENETENTGCVNYYLLIITDAGHYGIVNIDTGIQQSISTDEKQFIVDHLMERSDVESVDVISPDKVKLTLN